jgi:beta-lactamase class A
MTGRLTNKPPKFAGFGYLYPMMTLQKSVDETVAAVRDKFAADGLQAQQLALTLVDLTDALNPVRADYRGEASVYPASVIKLFYLAAAHHQMETGKLADTDELRRALREMIVDSGNDATSYVVDLLTGTTSGPELPLAELAEWHHQRNAVNRYFHAHGYPEINANRKTWPEGPYGRDKQAMDHFQPARNVLTANATARLLIQMAQGRCVTPARSDQMLALLQRDISNPATADYQAREFVGMALPPNAKLWSKAGYMKVARHDAAVVEFIDGRKIVLVIFTENCSDQKRIIPEIARRLVSQFAGSGQAQPQRLPPES